MQAIKANRVYTITEADVDSFRKEGYDIFDDDGKLVAYGLGKTVAFEKYAGLLELNEALMKENAELVSAMEQLAAEVETLKKSKRTSRKKEPEAEEN